MATDAFEALQTLNFMDSSLKQRVLETPVLRHRSGSWREMRAIGLFGIYGMVFGCYFNGILANDSINMNRLGAEYPKRMLFTGCE